MASTHAHLYASIAAALGALSGELHGGANSEVMKMLLEIGDVTRVKSWVSERLQKGRKGDGHGPCGLPHRGPQGDDPQRDMQPAGRPCGRSKMVELTKAVEAATKEEFRKLKGRDIYPNVDFYSASVYYMMGIPIDLFTPVFAISRISGWTAHIIEEKFAEAQPKPELYRPDADYVGTYCGPQACPYIPIEERAK